MESQEKSQEEGSGTESEKLMSHDTAVDGDGLEVGRSEKSHEEKQEMAVEKRQKKEEMMAADQAKIHRDRSQDDVENEEDGQFRWEEWDWESTVDGAGLAHEAFEPRESNVFRRRDDDQDEGGKRQGKRQGEVVRRQDLDEGGRMRVGKKDRMMGTGDSLKMTCNKKDMTGVEELELRRVIEMRLERTKMRKEWRWKKVFAKAENGEFGGLASAVQTETKRATTARRQRRESGEKWELGTETRDGSR